MIHLRIRWRVVFTPWCLLTEHRWIDVIGMTAFDRSGRSCRRCLRFEVFEAKGRDPKKPWLLLRDADGNVPGQWVKAK